MNNNNLKNISINSCSLNPLNLKSTNFAEDWKVWKKQFKIYLVARGLLDASDYRKNALFLHILGPETFEIFYSFNVNEETIKHEYLIERFDAYFRQERNVIIERCHFFKRNQLSNESIDDFLTALKKLSITCNFGTLKDELIRDRFILGLKLYSVRMTLIKESTKNLGEIIHIAKSLEAEIHGKELSNEGFGKDNKSVPPRNGGFAFSSSEKDAVSVTNYAVGGSSFNNNASVNFRPTVTQASKSNFGTIAPSAVDTKPALNVGLQTSYPNTDKPVVFGGSTNISGASLQQSSTYTVNASYSNMKQEACRPAPAGSFAFGSSASVVRSSSSTFSSASKTAVDINKTVFDCGRDGNTINKPASVFGGTNGSNSGINSATENKMFSFGGAAGGNNSTLAAEHQTAFQRELLTLEMKYQQISQGHFQT